MGTTLSGLVSGFDWSSMIDKLMAVARVPENQLTGEKAALTAKNSALSSLKTLFTDLQTSVATLTSKTPFQQCSAALGSTSSTWSVAAGAGTAKGEYKFVVKNLATTTQLNGKADVGRQLIVAPDTASDTVISSLNLAQSITAGEFTINGARISVAATDTLADVFANISAKAGVTAAYDSDNDKITLSGGSAIALGAANDTSNFLQALKLYGNGTSDVASATSLGVVRTSVSIGQSRLTTSIAGGAGTFTINGVQIGYNAAADSVQNVLDRISASTAGVTAGYDPVQDRFYLANKNTGDLGITIDEGANGFLAAVGLKDPSASLVAGKNAEFTVNGGDPIISRSNTLDAVTHGISGLSVTARTAGTETVTVGVSTSSARVAVDQFVTKYNALQASIDSMTLVTTSGTKVTAATLGGDRDISEMGRSLRATLFVSATGNGGAIKRLADLGIDFSGTKSTLEVKDSARLDRLLAENPTDVATYFSDATNGLGARLGGLLTKQLAVGGTLAVQTANNTKQSLNIDKQIADIERRLTAQRASMEASYIQMENVQSLLQQQSDALTRAFPATSSN